MQSKPVCVSRKRIRQSSRRIDGWSDNKGEGEGEGARQRVKERGRGTITSRKLFKLFLVRMLHKHAVTHTCDGPGRVLWRAGPVA